MITVILHDAQGNELKRWARQGNDSYLVTKQEDDTRFPLLSQLDNFSYSVFGSSDMQALTAELGLVKEFVRKQEVSEINELIKVVQQCEALNNCTLTFTPFQV